ncbi:hypothetical protein IVB46_04110 [Bradyrhizobium sp. 61]|uniref:hypothetical protein n=1 Tax=unclassified Bradyrhizobium TaxID=2631580 RepID=UPI001FF857AF|nr:MULTISPECIES: hypothetical protein [unclassified Bradyrhizobium]MCK1274426.1 hypothetical protein [Bradyrhizobium sp. 61]MCK1459821.1 hypothetical protein [Bradyrhizobium sp. 2]
MNLTFGAFAECSLDTATVGYRDASTGSVIASLEIPVQVIERAVLENASVDITLLSNGEIASAVVGAASDCLLRTTVSIDSLVDAFLTNENLDKEEATEAELRTLLGRLYKSVEVVERTIQLLGRKAI